MNYVMIYSQTSKYLLYASKYWHILHVVEQQADLINENPVKKDFNTVSIRNIIHTEITWNDMTWYTLAKENFSAHFVVTEILCCQCVPHCVFSSLHWLENILNTEHMEIFFHRVLVYQNNLLFHHGYVGIHLTINSWIPLTF